MTAKNSLKFIWLSANLFGYEVLKEVLRAGKIKISGVVTLSAKSKVKMYDGISIKKWYELGIPVYEVEDINSQEKLIEYLDPDFIIMAGWRQIINKSILDIPAKGFIGFHPSLLPKGRGPAPIINTILLDLKKSGVTMFYLGEGVDNGDIIGQVVFDVKDNDYAQDIYEDAIKGAKELVNLLPLLNDNDAPRTRQEEKNASYFPKRTLKDNEIYIDKDNAEDIYRKIRAFSRPYKGAFLNVRGKKIIIWEAQLENE